MVKTHKSDILVHTSTHEWYMNDILMTREWHSTLFFEQLQ